ncbi:transcription factor MYB1R1 [Brassica rapa]|uniref:Uncharacterized protein n=2 Tax=Brassica TaxID=3705 RepID=M4CVC2_BRACM|nr:transcription factor MYB1R1 [Brassica rapa]CAF2140038.1 unnamed protein product [Brassica napus]CDY46026.1 BnaA02g17000D [Brassica napus]
MADGSNTVACGISKEIMLFGVRVVLDPMRKSVSLNNLSDYKQTDEILKIGGEDGDRQDKNKTNSCYASADEAVPVSSNRERKRGVPWSEEEHKLFLLGLEKVGKGNWKGISQKFVKTRTSTQVASHAQKYFLRRSNLNRRRRRRSSLFDMTIPTVMPMEEVQENTSQPSSLVPEVNLVPFTLQASPEPISLSLSLALSNINEPSSSSSSSSRHSAFNTIGVA